MYKTLLKINDIKYYYMLYLSKNFNGQKLLLVLYFDVTCGYDIESYLHCNSKLVNLGVCVIGILLYE